MAMVEKRKTKSGTRGFTRLYAVQALYRQQMEKISLDALIKDARSGAEVIISEDYSVSEIDLDFFISLVSTVIEKLEEIDAIAESHMSDNWTFKRLDLVMQEIIRLGICELKFLEGVPGTVVFNEYIEIAKAFFEKNDVSFLNGLLNTVEKDNNL